ncbi:ATP-binding cassette domain-containing protein, partial [Helcococcus ovis]
MKLVIKNIKKSFKEKDVLIDASYQFENGKIYGLLGRNGAGKTTLFNILYRELEEDDGNIGFFDDEKLRELKVEDIGMVFA